MCMHILFSVSWIPFMKTETKSRYNSKKKQGQTVHKQRSKNERDRKRKLYLDTRLLRAQK